MMIYIRSMSRTSTVLDFLNNLYVLSDSDGEGEYARIALYLECIVFRIISFDHALDFLKFIRICNQKPLKLMPVLRATWSKASIKNLTLTFTPKSIVNALKFCIAT